jgi:transcriptional regulator with XRE-family HTH domain
MGDELGFGDLLRRHRTAAGLTQDKLAERAGLSLRGLSDLERGARRAPYRDTVLRLAEALGLEGPARADLLATVRHPRTGMQVRLPGPTQKPLPIPLSSFVGREREVAEVRRLLALTRLVTLTGTGGIGKTSLALQVCSEVVDDYPGGVWLVELAPVGDPRLLLNEVAAALGVPEEAGMPLLETLVAALPDRRCLLVLDNCEHLQAHTLIPSLPV